MTAAELQLMRVDLEEAEDALVSARVGEYRREGERDRLLRVCEMERERLRANLADAEAGSA